MVSKEHCRDHFGTELVLAASGLSLVQAPARSSAYKCQLVWSQSPHIRTLRRTFRRAFRSLIRTLRRTFRRAFRSLRRTHLQSALKVGSSSRRVLGYWFISQHLHLIELQRQHPLHAQDLVHLLFVDLNSLQVSVLVSPSNRGQ